MVLTLYKKDHETVMRMMQLEFRTLPNQTEKDIMNIISGLARERMSLQDFLDVPINYLNVIPPLPRGDNEMLLVNVGLLYCIDEIIMFFAHQKHIRIAQ